MEQLATYILLLFLLCYEVLKNHLRPSMLNHLSFFHEQSVFSYNRRFFYLFKERHAFHNAKSRIIRQL